MSHLTANQLLVTGTGAIVVLSLATTGYHAPEHMAEGGVYALVGVFMASFATVALLVTLLVLGGTIILAILFATLLHMDVPIANSLLHWFDQRTEPDWTDGRTVDPKGQAWRTMFGEEENSRLNLACQLAELATRPIAALLIYLLATL